MVHLAYGKTEGGTATANADGEDVSYRNLGASYNFGMVKPMLFIAQEKNGLGERVNAWQLGFTAVTGLHEFRVAYSAYDVKNSAASANDWSKWMLGYDYLLSKRKAVYAAYARVSNKGAQTAAVGIQGLPTLAASPGGASSGSSVGIRHSF